METVVRISMICYRATLTYTQDLRDTDVSILFVHVTKGRKKEDDLLQFHVPNYGTNYPPNFARKNLFYAKAY